MNKLYTTLGYYFWSYDSDHLFGIIGGNEYIWIYVCRGPMLTAKVIKEVTAYTPFYSVGYNNLIINGPCGQIVL